MEKSSMTLRVDVKPELFRWARERAGIYVDALVKRFPKYPEWENGERQPTLKQLEKLARATHAPIGSFFLSEPLDEPVPIPDMRTIGNEFVGRPSVELLDTVYLCLQRQDWYRDFARIEGEDPLAFVGSATTRNDVETTAREIRAELGFDVEERRSLRTWTEALRRFIEQADALGVLVMTSGIVGNNTHRRLDPEEFRGFALSDNLAPLVFINGADTKAAQMFTLAHELGHIWLGESALSDVDAVSVPVHEVEAWCNRIAAELLVPLASLLERYRQREELPNQLSRLAREFKVSTLVVLRRLHDVGALDREELGSAYGRELDRIRNIERKSGGSFHPTLKARVGRRFGGALVTSTLGGRTSFSESFRLLGIKKVSTLRAFSASL
jgi:Zn-dependent peptidase ImmA (M78 family)